MEELAGRVAVVTGAGSGIGRALALRFASAGLRVVLADRNPALLEKVHSELRECGAEGLAVPTDVTQADQVERLAESSHREFGRVDVLCNNAGVLGAILPTWEQPLEYWKWVLDVNLMGVVNGIHYFLPRILAQKKEAYILNTASIAGLVTGPFFGPYNASKHAVVALSEGLSMELRRLNSNVRVGVLCPGWVHTDLVNFESKLPGGMSPPGAGRDRHPLVEQREQDIRALVDQAAGPEEIAEAALEAIQSGRFYVFPHLERKKDVAARMRRILAEEEPLATTVSPDNPES